ncbi:hypothetical protein GCM10023083_88680 [Streptomyces phyllanthi]
MRWRAAGWCEGRGSTCGGCEAEVRWRAAGRCGGREAEVRWRAAGWCEGRDAEGVTARRATGR